jgi:DNA ligase-4
LLNASDEDQDGRYFKKTLAQIDELSLVRDRTGHVDEDDELDEPEPEVSEEDERVEDVPAPSARQVKLEDEWGLHRSKARSQSTQSSRPALDEEDTESERDYGDQVSA